MKTRDIMTYNGKEWKVVAIKGDYLRIRLVEKNRCKTRKELIK